MTSQDVIDLLRRWPLALQLDLPPRANVVIVGAYKGLTIELLDALYDNPHFIAYEPQGWARDHLAERIVLTGGDLRDRVRLRPVALGDKEEERTLWEHDTDAASFYRTGQRLSGSVKVVDVRQEIQQWFEGVVPEHIRPVDLLLMNCEGAEFEILPILLEEHAFAFIRQAVIQFHFGLGNDEGYFDICRSLLRTHTCLRADKDWHWWKNAASHLNR